MLKYLSIKQKMKNNYINITIIILGLILTSCQSVKDGLTGTRTNKSDEYLIEKKNPLVMPPEFQVLPEPKNTDGKTTEDKDFSINKILENDLNVENSKSKKIQENGALEELIIKKIKNK